MKSIIALILLLITSTINAQWVNDFRMTNYATNSHTSRNNTWCIASAGDTVHTVWYGLQDGNSEIYYRKSINRGINWQTIKRLTIDASMSEYPTICVSGAVVHVAWIDGRSGNKEIYYKRSTDAGLNWESDVRLTINPGLSESPSICVSGNSVHVVWMDNRDGNYEIFYKRSSNAGVNWGLDQRLTSNDSISGYPSIAVTGQFIHLAWVDYRTDLPEIYYKVSPDGGLSWLTDHRLTNSPGTATVPSIALSGNTVHVAWSDNRDGNYEKYYKRSTNSGVSWEADVRLTDNLALSGNACLAASGQSVHLTWNDSRDADYEIYYKRSTDGGVTWEPDLRLTNSAGESSFSSISLSGQVVHVLWQDTRNGNYEIYYKRNPLGNIITSIEPTLSISGGYKLDQNYPNPFNPSTNLKFKIKNSNLVKLSVYDMAGKEVAVLVNEKLSAGEYEYTFDGTNLSSGVYFYTLQTKGYIETKKMMLVK